MKKLLLLLSLTTAFAATEPSTVTFSVTITGTASASDSRAAKFIVDTENTARLAVGASLLATNNASAYRASYSTLLGQRVSGYHGENIAASAVTPKLSEVDFIDIKTAIVDALNGGKTPAQIITAIKQ